MSVVNLKRGKLRHILRKERLTIAIGFRVVNSRLSVIVGLFRFRSSVFRGVLLDRMTQTSSVRATKGNSYGRRWMPQVEGKIAVLYSEARHNRRRAQRGLRGRSDGVCFWPYPLGFDWVPRSSALLWAVIVGPYVHSTLAPHHALRRARSG